MIKDPFSSEVLLAAYGQGYFPMPDPETQELLWYRPDPRAIIPLERFHVSRSLAKKIRQQRWDHSLDQCFDDVMIGCAERQETWINGQFKDVYGYMHRQGHGHSVEVWREAKLVGGVYGLAIGGAFFAESMFHRDSDASKFALYVLVKHLLSRGFTLLECQFLTPHLQSLGAIEVSDAVYTSQLQRALLREVHF
jgi:leucyl/phenylalanyl-tRNA--protein transferase